jgi:Domain of unknown function (DUF5655)
MWTCPDCGRQFNSPQGWHSCIPRATVEAFLEGKPPGVVEAFHRLEEILRRLGPIEVEPVKSRIALKARTTFAGATFTKSQVRVGFVLARVVDDPRLKVESFGGRHVHTLIVTSPGELDDAAIRELLAEATGSAPRAPAKGSGDTRRRAGKGARPWVVPDVGVALRKNGEVAESAPRCRRGLQVGLIRGGSDA